MKSDSDNLAGCTIVQYVENGRQVADQISSGTYPAGTSETDWMIVGGVAVYKPYVPLYVTGPVAT